MKQKQSNQPLFLGAIALTIALAAVIVLNVGLGAAQAPDWVRIEPVPEVPVAAKSTPEPVPSPTVTHGRVTDTTGAQGPEPRPVPAPRSSLAVSTAEDTAPGSTRQVQLPSLLLLATGLLGVTAVTAHIASRRGAANGLNKSPTAQLEPSVKW